MLDVPEYPHSRVPKKSGEWKGGESMMPKAIGRLHKKLHIALDKLEKLDYLKDRLGSQILDAEEFIAGIQMEIEDGRYDH